MKNSDNADARRRDIISTIAYEYKWPDFQTKPHRLFSMSSALFALGIATVGIFGFVLFRRRRLL